MNVEDAKKEVRLQDKLSQQIFNSDAKTPYKPITKASSDTSNEFFEENNSTAKAIEVMIQPNVLAKTLELLNKIGPLATSLVKNLANHKGRDTNCFRLYIDPHIDTWSEIPRHA